MTENFFIHEAGGRKEEVDLMIFFNSNIFKNNDNNLSLCDMKVKDMVM